MSPDVLDVTRCPAYSGGVTTRVRDLGASEVVRCGGCRTEWVRRQPSDDRLAEIYGSGYYTPWHCTDPGALEAMKHRTFRPILDACGLSAGQSLLDVGCATGSFLALAADRGYDVYGVDLNPKAIDDAQARIPGAHLHCGVLADRPFAGDAFDGVVMVDFIEHVRDPEAELSTVRERLKPGARLVISTPRTDSPARAIMRGRWPQYREEHLTYFSRGGIATLLDRCGFRVETVRPTKKAITLGYAYGQAVTFPIPVVTPMVKLAYRALPMLRNTAVPASFGEMTVVAVPR